MINFRYGIMQKCWNKDPDERPNFSKILDLMNKIAGTITSIAISFSPFKNKILTIYYD